MVSNSYSTIKVFPFYYKKTPILIENETYHPIMAGKIYVDNNNEIQGDDTMDNISDKNKHYSELTGLYWVWKNTNQDIIGSCHYRRYFSSKPEPFIYKLKRLLYIPIGIYKKRYGLIYTNNTSYFLPRIINREEIEVLMNEYDAILPKARKLKYTVEEHYRRYHNINDLKIVESILSQKYPDYVDSFHTLLKSKRLYANNMFILRNNHFQEFMAWLFDIIFEFEKQVDMNQYKGYQERIIGFIAERLLSLWFIKNRLSVVELPVIYFKKQKQL